MHRSKAVTGIQAGTVIGVIMIIAATVSYLYFSSPPNTTSSTQTSFTSFTSFTSSSSSSASQSSSSSVSSSLSSSSSSSTTELPPVNSTSLILRLSDLFGNFSQVTADFVVNGTGSTISYSVLGQPIINSTRYFKVNMTVSHLAPVGTTSSSAIIWFSPSGTPVITQIGTGNFTGFGAQSSSQDFTALFAKSFSYAELLLNNSTSRSHFLPLNEKITSFGPTQLKVIEYNVPGPFRSIRADLTIYGGLVGLGTQGQAGQRMTVRILTHEAIQSTQGLFVFNLDTVIPQ